MNFLDNSPEKGFLSSLEQVFAHRPEVVEISKNAVEGIYFKLYNAGVFATESTLKTDEIKENTQNINLAANHDKEEAVEPAPVSNIEEARQKQEQLKRQSREIVKRLAA